MRTETRALLLAHDPSDATESRHRDDMLALVDGDGDPFSRHHYHPGHFTASAFVLSPDRSSLLLVDHRKIGMWVQPGGHFDPGDASAQAAAAREAAEEAGLERLEPIGDELFDTDVHEVPAYGDQPAHLHYDLRFLFRSPSPGLRPSPEVAGAEWIALGDVRVVSADSALARPVEKLGS